MNFPCKLHRVTLRNHRRLHMAMKIAATLLVISLASCGGGADSGMIRYRLIEGSSISLLGVPDGPVVEELSGSFTAVQEPVVGIGFSFAIPSLAFRGGSLFTVVGDSAQPECAGGSDVGRFGNGPLAPEVAMDACVSINGKPVFVQGGGPLVIPGFPPRLLTVEICGGPSAPSTTCDDIISLRAPGYVLRISAERKD